VSNATPEIVRIVPSDGFKRYIALSHCWRNGNPTRTTRLNLECRMSGFAFSELSRSFQDAVTVTRSLGINYLWIDCLCIVQDDHKD
jgi:heterokaryon incompatibility protein (HET)